MSTLSWFLYIIGVLDNLDSMIKLGLILSTIAIIMLSSVKSVCYVENAAPRIVVMITKYLVISSLVLVFLVITKIVLPSADTIKLIAVNELVLQNEQVQEIGKEALDVVKKWLQELKPE